MTQVLEAYNRRASQANVLCDKCGSEMDYDWEQIEKDQKSPAYHPSGSKPVKCKCGYVGRKLAV